MLSIVWALLAAGNAYHYFETNAPLAGAVAVGAICMCISHAGENNTWRFK